MGKKLKVLQLLDQTMSMGWAHIKVHVMYSERNFGI